jgi:hypothetical protein
MAVIPVAKALYLCEEVDDESGAINLYALLDFLRPRTYPHTQPAFVCFAQLRGGLGEVATYVDIRRAYDSRLIRTTDVLRLRFPNRDQLIYLTVNIEGCVFEEPGLYLVEL